MSFGPPEEAAARALIKLALAEDLGQTGDITSQALLGEDATGQVNVVARHAGVICGNPIGEIVLREVDPRCEWKSRLSDGKRVDPGALVASLSGSVHSLLTAERTILNFMTHLSGVATLTRRYVEAIAGKKAVILDTRKTLPGWRRLEKYAVRCGGGKNHRIGLWDAVLIKDNHLASIAGHEKQSLVDVVQAARLNAPPEVIVEIEVDSLEQLADVLPGKPDIVLLDNMGPDLLKQAVAIRNQHAPEVLLESSGGVDLSTVTEIARSGVDRISIGRLTHSAPALDLAFDWQ